MLVGYVHSHGSYSKCGELTKNLMVLVVEGSIVAVPQAPVT